MRQRSLSILISLIAILLLASCTGQPTPAPDSGAQQQEQAPASTEQEAAATEEAPASTEQEAAATEEAAAPSPDAPEFIELGAVVPLTGRYAGPGAQYERGYKYAVEDINAAGGVFVKEFNTSIPLRLNLLDDESDASKTVNSLETHFSDNNVVVYLGGVGSDLHAAAAAIAEKNKVPYLGAGFAYWGIHQQGYKYLFSPFWKSPAIAVTTYQMLNELIPEGERPTRVAIFQEQTDWGVELGGLWRDEAEKAGYEVVVYEEYAPLTEDFTDLILKAQQAEAQTVLALPSPPDGITIFKQMGELGYTPEFTMMVRAPDAPTWAEALGPVGDYVTLGPGWHNTVKAPGVDAVNAKHIEEVGRPADPGVGPSYAIVQIAADAIERAGTLDRDAIRDAIAATDLDTVVGHVTFREDGTGEVGSPILQYINGKQEVVWPTDIATADFVFPAPPFEEREAMTAAEGEAAATEEAMAEAGGEPSPDAPATIKVGAVVPLTGAFAGGGAQVERGYQMAVEAINANGGVFVKAFNTSIPLELIVLDDESDPSKTVSQLETEYSENDVVAYLGGFGSSLHAAAAAIAEKNQVPYLGVAFALWQVHQQGYQYLFSPFWKSPDVARTTFQFLNDSIPEGERPTRVGIFQEQTDWGVEMGGLWREEAEKAGYEVVVYEEYAPLTEDFTDLILKAQEAEVQTLLALPNPPDGITIFKQMAELGYTPDFSFFVRAPDVPTWAESLGPVGDYVTLGPGWHNAVQYAGVDELNAKHQELMGRPSDPMVGPSYAAVQILADAIERAGTLDRAAIREAIAATDLDTVVGPVSFNEDGTGVVGSPILQYQNGKVELVWPKEFATADFVYPAPPFEER